MIKTRITIVVIAAIIFALYIIHILLPLGKGYQYFIEYAAEMIHKKQRIDAIGNALTPERFASLKTLAYVFGGVLIIFFSVLLFYSSYIHLLFSRIFIRVNKTYHSFAEKWSNINAVSKMIFLGALIYLTVQSLMLMASIPLIHDEAYTISNFVIPGPLVSATFYPYPNNHILFSLLSYPFSFLPINPQIAFRLPSLLIMILVAVVLFRLLLIFLKDTEAALGVVVFVCLLPVMAYSVFARGYCLVLLFSSLSLYAVIKIVSTPSLYYWALFILFSVAGLYTLPSYMYPFAAIIMVLAGYGIVSKNIRFLFNSLLCVAACGLLTILLYMPVIFTSGGWSNFVQVLYSGYEDSVPLNKVGEFVNAVYGLQFFERTWVVMLFFIIVAFSVLLIVPKLWKRRITLADKILYALCLAGFLLPIISFMVQRKMAAPRTHVYVSLFICVLLFVSVKLVVQAKWRMGSLIVVAILIASLNIAYARKTVIIYGEAYIDKTADLFANRMLNEQTGNTDTCYTFDMFYLATLNLKYLLAKRQLVGYQSEKNSPSTRSFSIRDEYEWLITVKGQVMDTTTLKVIYYEVVRRDNGVLWRRKPAP